MTRVDRDGTDRVEVGRVIKPHGLRGEVVVLAVSDVDDRFAPGVAVWVDGVASTIATSRPHQGRPLVRFAHVTDRTAAELLRGAVIEAAPVDAVELDTYLASELIGVEVRDASGAPLGVVSNLIEMPAVAGYDLLEVTTSSGRTWLLPAADELVEAVEDDDGLHLVAADLPDGLIDVPDGGTGAAGEDRLEGER
jgi:16S rRNA processing protein RimM